MQAPAAVYLPLAPHYGHMKWN